MLNGTDLKKYRWAMGGLLALAALLYFKFGRGVTDQGGLTFTARRGPLQISILEGGSIEARESQEIRSGVKGYQGTKILSIVEEGYLVTEEDVRKGKVLVELDSSEVKQRITTQDIQVESTKSSLIEARQAYEIQLNQNTSDIKASEQKVRFARMDVEKYLGDRVSNEVIEQLGLKEEIPIDTNALDQVTGALESISSSPAVQFAVAMRAGSEIASDAKLPLALQKEAFLQPGGAKASSPPVPAREPDDPNITAKARASVVIDFAKYAKAELLGDGEAKQKLRKLEDDLLVAQNELGLADAKLAGTKRLRERDFVTKTEYDNEVLTVKKATLKVDTSKTALDLFIKYEFTKAAEEFLSKYEEALRGLERARKEAISKLAQARARWRSAESRFRIEEVQQRELYEQLEKCVIRALKPGLVVYGGGGDRRFYSGEDQIREGATVRERQPIITIPDMTQMSVKVKIHEAHIKKVKKGLKARVQIDAFPDEELTGEVSKVGVLPDSQDRWMNPDLKVYLTTIDIEGAYEWVKPGMSAKVEVQVNTLDDVLYVPLQAVAPSEGKHFCYVANGGEPERREVEVGEFNDEFIEIRKGLKEGEKVLLRGPEAAQPESSEGEDSGAEENREPADKKTKPAQPAGQKPAAPPPAQPRNKAA